MYGANIFCSVCQKNMVKSTCYEEYVEMIAIDKQRVSQCDTIETNK